MRLSVFTTVTNPRIRGDHSEPSLACYRELADELVIVNGGKSFLKSEPHIINQDTSTGVYSFSPCELWPQEFSWEFIGEQFQRGYENCTGDVVIHADLDFIFHEHDFDAIKRAAQTMLDNHQSAMSFYKWQFILPDRYNLKSRLIIMVNKRDYGDRIRFNSGGDLAQPSLDGNYISPDDVPESKIRFFNYEKLLKTKDQIADDQGRMERAYRRRFGHYQMRSDGTDEGAYNKWVESQIGKFNKPQERVSLESHPKYMQDSIRNLKPEQWGYSGHGYLVKNDYVTEVD